MLRLAAVALAVASASIACAAEVAPGEVLLIGNKGEDTVSFVDLATGQELGRSATGKMPHEIAISPDGKQAAVVAYGDKTIDLFDVATRAKLKTIDLAPNEGPHGIAWLKDGRIVVTAAKKFGAKGFGYDIDPERVKESKANVKENKVDELVKIEEKDIFTLDLSGASVITLYLLPSLNVKLVPQLKKLKDGSRIVSHNFDMQGYKPKKKTEVEVGGRTHTVYLWVTPLEEEK